MGFISRMKKTANPDGQIDSRDAVYPQLVLWRDRNHNGVSTPDEVVGLGRAGVTTVSLSWSETRRTDRFGNRFRYRSRVVIGGRPSWAVDVFLIVGP